LLPARAPEAPAGYDIYPAHPLGPGQIQQGFDLLAERLADADRVVIDGFMGVDWEGLRAGLEAALERRGRRARWQDVTTALRPEPAVDALVGPFLGGDDPLFGTRFTGCLGDFFEAAALAALQPAADSQLSILYGPGAALAGWPGTLLYADLPKNEIQFRSRAGLPVNLGCPNGLAAKAAYKRCYFVDWPALTAHKAAIAPRIDIWVDAQRPDQPAHAAGDTVRAALAKMASTVFRVRPWFEPGPWGGQWIKRNIAQLPTDVPNYAWSFELISPENGLLLESDGALLEVSFDTLMAQEGRAVLGDAANRFGSEFPIRFDFLDTVDGGNLSVQVHPRPDYIKRHFGESFTQDETYYILDAVAGAEVYLGLTEDADLAQFRAALEQSEATGCPVDVDRFVGRHPAGRHDLFLIPSGTIHCSGTGNLVLEISATPYIFTFKVYDWLRADLDGRPRPLNIARAFDNLCAQRRGEVVDREHKSKPETIGQGPGWQLIHLPTHPEHFYDVHRVELDGQVELRTDGSCQVMSLAEGEQVSLEVAGERRTFHLAETFVVPAGAQTFTLRSGSPVKVVKAFIKPEAVRP
jgi:mannose-6-phosphate isomerase class I